MVGRPLAGINRVDFDGEPVHGAPHPSDVFRSHVGHRHRQCGHLRRIRRNDANPQIVRRRRRVPHSNDVDEGTLDERHLKVVAYASRAHVAALVTQSRQ